MKHHKVRRTALLPLAMLFLAIAWVWDGLIGIARFVVGLIPWTRFKEVFAALVDRLPLVIVLLIFVVPLAIVEPALALAAVAIAMGYVVSGVIAWIVLKLLSIGLIAGIFDLTKHRLLTIPWFAWVYDKLMAFHHYAHRIVAPYQHAAATLLRQWRRRAAAATIRLPGAAQLAARFAARRRASNGRPPLPLGG
jgi:hypothetical protein